MISVDDPTGPSGGRLHGIDAARGVALAGMILVNVGPTEPQSLLQRVYLLPYGRASVLFMVIAGIGMGFMLRSRRDDVRRWPTLVWRAGLLFIGGIGLQQLTDDVSVILPVYGILFAASLLLQYAPQPIIGALALTMVVLGPALIVSHVALEEGEHFTGPLRLDEGMTGLLHGLVFSGRYPLLTWCVPFLFGMWIAGLDLRRPPTLDRLVVGGAMAAVGGFALGQLFARVLPGGGDAGFTRLLTGTAHGQMPLWLVSSVGGAVLVVAGFLRLPSALSRGTWPLAAAGQLALTLYVGHVLVLALVKPSDGFTIGEGVTVTALMVTSFLAVAVSWRRLASVGPLEWLFRASWLRSRAA